MQDFRYEEIFSSIKPLMIVGGFAFLCETSSFSDDFIVGMFVVIFFVDDHMSSSQRHKVRCCHRVSCV